MKKKIVSTLVVIGLLIVLGGYSYNVQYRQKPEIKHFTAFFSVTGRPLGMQNDIKEIIADKIGADCEENWLVGQSKEEVLNSYIASGEYPDFILGEKALNAPLMAASSCAISHLFFAVISLSSPSAARVKSIGVFVPFGKITTHLNPPSAALHGA